jgi:hypothetical protein
MGGGQFSSGAWSGGRAGLSKRGRSSDRDLRMWRDRGRKSRRDASGTKERMQDSGVMAFNGWDDFQDVVIEFLAWVDWRCRTELDFAEDGLFSGGK